MKKALRGDANPARWTDFHA